MAIDPDENQLSQLSDAEIVKLTRKMVRKFYNKGFESDAEDLAQEFMLARVKKGTIEGPKGRAAIDAIRFYYGRPETYRSRKREILVTKPLNPAHPAHLHEVNHDDFETYLKPLKKNYRAMFILHYKWNLNFREIAHLWGVTPSRITQIFQACYEQMKKKL